MWPSGGNAIAPRAVHKSFGDLAIKPLDLAITEHQFVKKAFERAFDTSTRGGHVEHVGQPVGTPLPALRWAHGPT